MPSWAVELAAQDGLRLIAPGDIDEVTRQQLVLVESRAVAFERALVLDPALDEVEGDLEQLVVWRAWVQILDVDDVR